MSKIQYVLVTGATGFIGAHVVDELLRRGLKVRAAARSREKAEKMTQDRPQYKNQLEFVFVGDLAQPGEFDEAVKGVDAIIHLASPVRYDMGDIEAELMKPAISSTESMLEAAKKEKGIKRVVLTSSFAAVVNTALGPAPGRTYTAKDWNPVTYEEAKRSGDPLTAYRAGKKFAESVAWDCIREHPHFDLVTLCPPVVFGPVVHPIKRVEDLNHSNMTLWSLAAMGGKIPEMYTPCWVDVRDLAYAHVEALLRPEVSNKRYTIAAPGHFTFKRAAEIVRQEFDWAAKGTATDDAEKDPLEDAFFVDGEAVSKDLDVCYHMFKDTVIEAIGQFRELQLHQK